MRIIAIKVNEGGLYQCMVSLSDGSSNLVRFNIQVMQLLTCCTFHKFKGTSCFVEITLTNLSQVDGVRGFITKEINARERQDVKLSELCH